VLPPPSPLQEHEKNELEAEAQRKGRVSYSLRGAIKSMVQQVSAQGGAG
jgi:hypothetical protein